jgi:YgiT-type zinc finger domain-containing protein
MKCGICKAETEEGFVTYTEDVNQAVVVIRHVPARVCTECGDVWYSGAVAAHLEAIVDALTSAPLTSAPLTSAPRTGTALTGTAHTEVAVVNYTETAG